MDFAHANNPLLLKRALRRDRAIVGIALLILILFAWLENRRRAPRITRSRRCFYPELILGHLTTSVAALAPFHRVDRSL